MQANKQNGPKQEADHPYLQNHIHIYVFLNEVQFEKLTPRTLRSTFVNSSWDYFRKHYLCKSDVAYYSCICISTQSRLQNASKFAISVWYMPPASYIAFVHTSISCTEKQHLTFDIGRTYPWLSAPSLNFLMTVPNVMRLLLMWEPSLSRTPSAPVLAARSEPARSTKF